MLIIEIDPLENGAHRNQNVAWDGVMEDYFLPDGWAIVPEEIEIPATFPFVNVKVENGIVTEMTAGVVPPEPEPEPDPDPEPEPTGDYATKEDVEAVYTELANAFREGVNGYEQ